MMKSYLLIIIAIVFFSSCKKDDALDCEVNNINVYEQSLSYLKIENVNENGFYSTADTKNEYLVQLDETIIQYTNEHHPEGMLYPLEFHGIAKRKINNGGRFSIIRDSVKISIGVVELLPSEVGEYDFIVSYFHVSTKTISITDCNLDTRLYQGESYFLDLSERTDFYVNYHPMNLTATATTDDGIKYTFDWTDILDLL